MRQDRNLQYEQFAQQLAAEIDDIEGRLGGFEGETLASESYGLELKYGKLKGLERDRQLAALNNAIFLNELSAEFVLRILEAYVLPLLYGLLGAFLFVLRSLAKDVRRMVYCRQSDSDYRLRLTLGALAGLAIGWLLTPEQRGEISVLSTFALPLLAGYNVELLFSLMDRLISTLTQQESPSEETGREPPSFRATRSPTQKNV